MIRKLVVCVSIFLAYGAAIGQEDEPQDDSESATLAEQTTKEAQPASAAEAPAEGPGQVKTLSGISILGNEEAPKALVIVPWKSSEIGDGLSVNDVIDDRARPVDKDVFLREVHYYQLRSGEGS